MTYALLIDDERGARESLARAADEAGYELLTAEDWDEGVAMFQVYSPALVIADYNLPGSRLGIKLLAEIRRLTPAVRLVLLSGYIDEADVPAIEGLGLVDRAIPKTREGVTEQLLEEIGAARADAHKATDWQAYADAHQNAKMVEQSDIDELDRRLKQTRGLM